MCELIFSAPFLLKFDAKSSYVEEEWCYMNKHMFFFTDYVGNVRLNQGLTQSCNSRHGLSNQIYRWKKMATAPSHTVNACVRKLKK